MRPDYATWGQAFLAALHAADRTGKRHRVTSNRAVDGERRWKIAQVSTACVFCFAH